MNHGRPGASTLLLAIGVLALSAVAVALVSQHQFGMEPCPWCILQRLLMVVIGALGLLGWLARPRGIVLASSLLALAAAISGVAAALYQNLVAAKSSSCNLTLADKVVGATHLDQLLPDVFEVRASCADAAVKVLGVPYELWSAGLFVILAGALIMVLRER